MDFAEQLSSILDEYQNQTVETLASTIDEISSESVTALHGAYPGKTGEYSRGWTSKKKSKGNMYQRIIYGKSPTYRLAHLLEHGHAKRNGGRVVGREHIRPIEESAVEKLIERLKAKL